MKQSGLIRLGAFLAGTLVFAAQARAGSASPFVGSAKEALETAAKAAAGMPAVPAAPAPGAPGKGSGAPDVHQYFETLASRLDPAVLASIRATYRFEIAGAGTWIVSVRQGRVDVSEGEQFADCVLSAKEETFRKIIRNELTPATAYASGDLKVRAVTATGQRAALLVHRLFRAKS